MKCRKAQGAENLYLIQGIKQDRTAESAQRHYFIVRNLFSSHHLLNY